jgi:hypothetical protein
MKTRNENHGGPQIRDGHGGVFTATIKMVRQKVKVNFSICLTNHHAMKTCWGMKV